MRISNSMIASNFMNNFQKNSERLDKLNNHLASKQKILLPSDNPLGTLKSMQLQTILNENEQYISNIKRAEEWIDICDGTLDSLKASLDKVRELALDGANGDIPQSERDTICKEVEEIADYFVQLANTTIGDRYVFSGYKTKTKPYVDYASAYQGDGNFLSVEIGQSVQLDYSLPGDKIFEDTFDAVRDVIQDLQTGNVTRLSGATLEKLDTAIDTAVSSRTNMGAKAKRLELVESRLDKANTKHDTLLTELMVVDVAETVVDVKQAENAYLACLAAGSRLMQTSIIDFLK